MHKPHRDRDSTTGREYHFKGHEPSERMLRAVYTWFDTLPPSLYTLAHSNVRGKKISRISKTKVNIKNKICTFAHHVMFN